LKNVNKQIICNTHWEVFLSRQVNYDQVVVKCQILQECLLQSFNMQKFQNMEHSNSRTFKDFSRTLWSEPWVHENRSTLSDRAFPVAASRSWNV